MLNAFCIKEFIADQRMTKQTCLRNVFEFTFVFKYTCLWMGIYMCTGMRAHGGQKRTWS